MSSTPSGPDPGPDPGLVRVAPFAGLLPAQPFGDPRHPPRREGFAPGRRKLWPAAGPHLQPPPHPAPPAAPAPRISSRAPAPPPSPPASTTERGSQGAPSLRVPDVLQPGRMPQPSSSGRCPPAASSPTGLGGGPAAISAAKASGTAPPFGLLDLPPPLAKLPTSDPRLSPPVLERPAEDFEWFFGPGSSRRPGEGDLEVGGTGLRPGGLPPAPTLSGGPWLSDDGPLCVLAA